MKVINDAMCLQGLNDMSSMNVPIQSPLGWPTGSWQAGIDFDVTFAPLRTFAT